MHPSKSTQCPLCHAPIDVTTDPVSDAFPKAGDFSICLYCIEIAVFNEDLTLRPLDEFEKAKLDGDPTLAAEAYGMQEVLRHLKAKRQTR